MTTADAYKQAKILASDEIANGEAQPSEYEKRVQVLARWLLDLQEARRLFRRGDGNRADGALVNVW